MGSLEDLKVYIRFRLEQLGSENAHHEFEKLCFELARKRVCSNIIPATGPVSAGGDQGRDAESIRTHLQRTGLGDSAFVGLTNDRPIVIACTLTHKSKIRSKIKQDIKAIADTGRCVSDIHYFCSSDIAVALRHDLEQWAKQQHAVDLHIRDGQAISRDLADPDCFFIAMEFLSIPAEMYPEPVPDLTDNWYREFMTALKGPESTLLTFATFSELRRATRHATIEPELQHDLPLLIEALRRFESQDAPQMLRRRALYERSVATLRGTGTLRSLEVELRRYFSEVIDAGEIGDLEDAAVLVTYCTGAVPRHAVQFDAGEVSAWRDTLIRKVELELGQARTPGRKCSWLDILGYLQLTVPDSRAPDRSLKAINTWLELAESADYAPLFPLERFANRLTEAVPFIGNEPKFELLTGRVDELLAKRFGKFVAAEKCRDRAIAFYEQGQVLRAISELHQAKVNWFAEETLRGSLLTMLFIAQCYADLGLVYAAKYYCLAAAWVAIHSDDDDVRRICSRAVSYAAQMDYRLGNWTGWLRLVDFGMTALYQFSPDPGNFEENPELEEFCRYGAAVIGAAEFLDQSVAAAMRKVLNKWGLDKLIEDLLPEPRRVWAGKDQVTVRSNLDEKLGVRVLEDLVETREAVWHELGLLWAVRWPNDYESTAVAEEFVATLQVAVTDFSRHDLLLLNTRIDITVSVGDVELPGVESVASNEGRIWTVVLPKHGPATGGNRALKDAGALAVGTQVIREVSLLPDEEFMSVFREVMEAGLMAKVFVAQPYHRLYREFLPRDGLLEELEVPEFLRADRPSPVPTAHPALASVSSLAPGYSREESLEVIARRYFVIQAKIPVTLQRLRGSKEFQEAVQTLRGEGWRDWHILLAASNIAMNVRLRQQSDPLALGARTPSAEDLEAFKARALEVSSDIDLESLTPLDLGEFNLDNLRQALEVSMGSTLKGWGLHLVQETPDIPAVAEFLGRRYNYWKDDVEHVDPFDEQETDVLILPFDRLQKN
jgi:hypothetical protein